ncbi:alpha/beta hydrolase [Mangrovicoccus algicola]|uniref:Alpha/beta hydrolase fold domain-containing protein n=1 Tax=Mangrovicoccus algicola TaxID=2771008 RepID=A0A8J6YZN9_9RHOB|nr:alpha/beta hydrolase fold domain-containing protein [Mangrovicoccus algicola]MBE3638828.1 alpha/beta hydrolase fold domain-containing protein [Mangrovicoccus algicola]
MTQDRTDRPGTEAALRARIARIPVEGSPAQMRRGFARLAGAQPQLVETERGGVPCLAAGAGPELVWFHGGGYVFGAPETHGLLARYLAAQGLRVLLPRYRLAPEHPWPAMLEDAMAVARASGPAAVLGGDSAGGHLALSAALRCDVAGLALVSPNTDRSGRSRTRDRDGDAMNDDATDARLFRMAMPGADPGAGEASPVLADLSRLPPLHLEAAGAEMLLDDTLILAREAALAGADLRLRVVPGLFHLFPLWPDALPEGAAVLARIAAFVHEMQA